jgi:hypothetical protein
MKARPTLYELLGVPQGAALAEIQAAYRLEVNALEAQRAAMPAPAFTDRMQMLRMAYSTLTDAASRTGYDAKLQEAAARAAPPAAPAYGTATPALALALGTDPHPGAAAASADARADALAMRADALALRADAMLLRAGIEPGLQRGGGGGAGLAAGALTGVKLMARSIGLLVIVGFVVFGIARCSSTGSAQKRMAIEAKAAEQTALQEYFQTHGVRPANMAEMQLLEAERRRKDNEQRQAEQRKRFQAQEQTRFEEDARRRAEQVSSELNRQDQEARYRAERDAERERSLKARAEQLKLESDLARNEADRKRLDLLRKQTLEQLKQP